MPETRERGNRFLLLSILVLCVSLGIGLDEVNIRIIHTEKSCRTNNSIPTICGLLNGNALFISSSPIELLPQHASIGISFDQEHVTRRTVGTCPTRNNESTISGLYEGIIVVECPWAAMRLDQAGFRNVVSLLGTQIFEDQIKWLSRAPGVLLMLDGDRAGRDASARIAHSLQPVTTVYTHLLPDNKEPEDLTDESFASILRKYPLSF